MAALIRDSAKMTRSVAWMSKGWLEKPNFTKVLFVPSSCGKSNIFNFLLAEKEREIKMRMKDDKIDHAVNNFTMESAIAKMSDTNSKESCLSIWMKQRTVLSHPPHMFRKLTLLAAPLSASHASSPTTILSLPSWGRSQRSQRYNPTRSHFGAE